MAQVYRILVADDHVFTLDGVERALAATPGLEVVGRATDGIEAIALAKALKPHVAVLDHGLPGANGIEALIEIRRWSPGTRVAIITGTDDLATLARIRDAGVHGIFRKVDPPEEFCAGVLAIARGATRHSASTLAALRGLDDAPALSPRETEVLFAIARGLTNRGIADELSLSAKTVDSHRTSLMRKLSVHSTAQLLARAVQLGLVRY